MGAVDTTYTFTATDTITSTKMNNIIDQTTITTDAIIGTTLDVASGKLKVRSAGITSNEIGAASVTQTALAPNVVGNGPAFHVNMGGTHQSLPNNAANQIIRFNTEVFDVGSCFDTSNYQFKPNVAGYYQINLAVQIDSGGPQLGVIFASIRKNATVICDTFIFNTQNNFSVLSSGSILVYLNGTNDYVDAHALMSGGSSSAYIVGSTIRTYMSGFLARSA